jgi:hypothetical protein
MVEIVPCSMTLVATTSRTSLIMLNTVTEPAKAGTEEDHSAVRAENRACMGNHIRAMGPLNRRTTSTRLRQQVWVGLVSTRHRAETGLLAVD